MKNNDVYKFIKSPIKDNWCFDNQLVVKDDYLIDTYWGYMQRDFNESPVFKNDSSCKRWKIDEVDLNDLQFICNLDDVVTIDINDVKYYKNEDIIDLGYQHNSYNVYVLKDGATRDKEIILNELKDSIKGVECSINYNMSKLKELNKLKEDIENNKIQLNNVYFL